MTHCAACPLRGCADCRYSGGVCASPGTVFATSCETMGVRKTAPGECANTAEGLTAYTEFIGQQLIAHIEQEKAA